MDQQLKQRLIGVTIIVSLIVIFVPMLFDKADQQTGTASESVPPVPEAFQEKAIDLPKTAEDVAPKDTGSVSESGYKIIPLTEEAPQKSTERAELKAMPAEPVEAPMEEEQFEPAPEKPLRPTEKLREEPAKPAVEQVEKPGKAELAEKKAKEAKKAKAPVVQTTPVKPKSVAPAIKPAEAPVRKSEATARAEPAPANIKVESAPAARSQRPKPEIQTAQPAKSAPAPARPVAESLTAAQPIPKSAAAPGGLDAWVVQTGSFTTEDKARALAEKLRQAKFAAFVEAVPGKTGSLYRVQVGPELERARAEQMQKQIETNLGIRGIIIPHH